MRLSRAVSWSGRPSAAVAGVLAGALALGVAHLVAALTVPAASPFLAVGATAIDLTPGWLKDLAIAWFGVRDKLALGVGMAVVLAAVTGLSGVLAARRTAAGAVAVVCTGTSRPPSGSPISS